MHRRMLDRYTHRLSPESRTLPGVKGAIRKFRNFQRRGIETVPDLIAAYPDLSSRSREFAVWALGIMDDRTAVPLLKKVYRADPRLRGAAATALGILGGKRAYEFAVGTLRDALDAERVDDRDLDAAVILFVHMAGERGRLLDDPDDPDDPVFLLVDLLRRTGLSAWARGEAASGLGHILEFGDKRRRRWRKATEAVVAALSDDEPYVRHEAAHACGDMRLESARPTLRRMVKHDEGRGGWGSVAREAQGALYAIDHGDFPEWWWENRDPD